GGFESPDRVIAVGYDTQKRTEPLANESRMHAIEQTKSALCHHFLKIECLRGPRANAICCRQEREICQRQTIERRGKSSSDAVRNRRQTGEMPEDVDESNYG